MSKLTNIVKKGMLFHILVAFVLAAALVIGGVFGFNSATELTDTNTLTVTVNSFAYNNYLDTVEEECEKVFDAEGVNVAYKMNGEMSGDDCELLFVFEEGVNLENVKTALEKSFDEKTADGGALAGSFISVSTSVEDAKAVVAKGYALRGAIAIVVFAALAFAYVAIRYRWDMGVVAAICVALGSVLTAAIVALVRIPVTTSLLYVVAIGGLLSAVTTLMTLNKVRANEKEDVDAAEAVASGVAVKQIGLLCGGVAVALVALAVVGVIVNIALLWFAVIALVAVAVAAFIGVLYAPVVYIPLKGVADKKAAEKATGYQGAKKTSTKVKKIFVKEVKEEVKEEATEEAAVEETAEEVVEEATEEVAEEAEEAPVAEEAAEEVVVEETTEEVAEETAEEAEASEETAE